MQELYLLREQATEPFQLKATLMPADADDLKLTYTSDNPLVATVSANGMVTPTGGYGTAVITVASSSGAENDLMGTLFMAFEYGPSDDPVSYCYFYTDGALYDAGTIEALPTAMQFFGREIRTTLRSDLPDHRARVPGQGCGGEHGSRG